MFAVGDRVLGIQFHLEVTPASVDDMLRHGASDLGEGPFVQTPAAIAASKGKCEAAHALLDRILDQWSA
jgi:hypothetical protein